MPATHRPDLAPAVVLMRQKRFAAQALLRADAPAEALRLAFEAAAAALSLSEALPAWGLRDAEARALTLALADAQNAAPPLIDDLVEQAHVAQCERWLDACATLERAFERAALSPRDALRMRLRRGVAVASALALGAWAVDAACAPWATATASLTLQPERAYAASNVLDGDPATEWVLPAGRRGWIDLRLARPRPVTSVRLRNATRHGDEDHGTQDYIVELYAGEILVGSQSGTLASVTPEAPWITLIIAAHHVDRVRFVARSCWGLGAGLADVEVR